MVLAKQLGLREQAVFFGDWVPYEEWTNYLADADVAVSLHFNTLETQFFAVPSCVLSYMALLKLCGRKSVGRLVGWLFVYENPNVLAYRANTLTH